MPCCVHMCWEHFSGLRLTAIPAGIAVRRWLNSFLTVAGPGSPGKGQTPSNNSSSRPPRPTRQSSGAKTVQSKAPRPALLTPALSTTSMLDVPDSASRQGPVHESVSPGVSDDSSVVLPGRPVSARVLCLQVCSGIRQPSSGRSDTKPFSMVTASPSYPFILCFLREARTAMTANTHECPLS